MSLVLSATKMRRSSVEHSQLTLQSCITAHSIWFVYDSSGSVADALTNIKTRSSPPESTWVVGANAGTSLSIARAYVSE